MNEFLYTLKKHGIDSDIVRRGKLTTLQVNMGDLCNQSCRHCHIWASPKGEKIMSGKVVSHILSFLSKHKVETLDITGGAPELNPDFDCLVRSARPYVDDLIVRSNLTVLFEKHKEYLADFFSGLRIHIICSLPCYTKENVDSQRGEGVFEKSIKALLMLNGKGYSRNNKLRLDLVYNPSGAFLPSPQEKLEADYRKVLRESYGIEFNRLFTITNVAINRFKRHLLMIDEYEKYLRLLENNFNRETLKGLMCLNYISVGFDGRLYDCDFNLALGYQLKDEMDNSLTIERLDPGSLQYREIIMGEQCFACTAGHGSSCRGALTAYSAA